MNEWNEHTAITSMTMKLLDFKKYNLLSGRCILNDTEDPLDTISFQSYSHNPSSIDTYNLKCHYQTK